MKHDKLRRYLRRGTLTQLAVFEAVARHASFTRAAQELHMAQPTVSIQVKKLAELLGVTLFDTQSKRACMTPAGRELYAAVQDVLLKVGELDDRLARLRAPECGRLRIGVSTTAEHLAPKLLARFCDCHRGIAVSLAMLNREQLLQRLAVQQDDLYILSNPPADAPIVMQTLAPNALFFYARADHPLARQRNVDLAAVAAEPLLMREAGSGMRLATERLFRTHNLCLTHYMELGSNEAIKHALAMGLGVALVSQDAMAGGKDLVALDVVGLPLRRWWCLAHPEGASLSPPARAFWDLCKVGASAEAEPAAMLQ